MIVTPSPLFSVSLAFRLPLCPSSSDLLNFLPPFPRPPASLDVIEGCQHGVGARQRAHSR